MGSIVRKTKLPGPNSKAGLERLRRAVPRSLWPTLPILTARANGAVLEDVDGNCFLDFAGGLGALNTGHSHPTVVTSLKEQASAFLHTDFSLVPYASYVELADGLAARTPVRGERRVAFFNSGAEAVENAVKIARKATGRPGIVCFEGAFHGRTLMALSLTSRVDPYKCGFGPFAPEVYRVPYANPYRHSGPLDAAQWALQQLERAFSTRVCADDVAAIIVEPIQGEGGFVVPPTAFLKGLRDIADRHGIVLIVDEIQTGYGRTGRFFALEHFGIEADLMTVGKSLASGLPLSAVVGTQALMDAVGPGGLGGTTIGNPLACQAGLAVLHVMDNEGLVARANVIGEALRSCLTDLGAEYPQIGDVRGLGAMIGAEFVESSETGAPAGSLAKQTLGEIFERGLIAAVAGIHGHVLRFLPPLVTTDDQLGEAGEVLRQGVAAALRPQPQP